MTTAAHFLGSADVLPPSALMNAKQRQLPVLKWRVAIERAEAADWIMRILNSYNLVSGSAMVEYLQYTVKVRVYLGCGCWCPCWFHYADHCCRSNSALPENLKPRMLVWQLKPGKAQQPSASAAVFTRTPTLSLALSMRGRFPPRLWPLLRGMCRE